MSARGNTLNYGFTRGYSKITESRRHPTILVEGNNDKIVYRDIFGEDAVIVSYGKDNVIKELIKSPSNNKIGIIDKDYDELEDINNLFYTDYNDLECMAINLIDKDNFFKYIKLDMAEQDKFIRVYDTVLRDVKELSNLWRYCYNNRFSLLIKEYDKQKNVLFNNIVNVEKKKLKYDKIYELLGSKIKLSKDNMIQIMKENSFDNFRGHDFFSLLYFYVNRENIRLNIEKLCIIDDKKIEECFIKESSKDKWIINSKLYKDIKSKFSDILV